MISREQRSKNEVVEHHLVNGTSPGCNSEISQEKSQLIDDLESVDDGSVHKQSTDISSDNVQVTD